MLLRGCRHGHRSSRAHLPSLLGCLQVSMPGSLGNLPSVNLALTIPDICHVNCNSRNRTRFSISAMSLAGVHIGSIGAAAHLASLCTAYWMLDLLQAASRASCGMPGLRAIPAQPCMPSLVQACPLSAHPAPPSLCTPALPLCCSASCVAQHPGRHHPISERPHLPEVWSGLLPAGQWQLPRTVQHQGLPQHRQHTAAAGKQPWSVGL